MSENMIKICYNNETKETFFQFFHDNGKWSNVDNSSALSRKHFATAIAEGRIEELLDTINLRYNVDDCGVKIFYTGNPCVFNKIAELVPKYKNMKLQHTTIRCAILGKRNTGKSVLCEALFEFLGKKPEVEKKKEYTIYSNEAEGLYIYEIHGIDIGVENVELAYSYLRRSIESGVKTILYCFSGKAGKIEEMECSLIKRIEKEGTHVIPVISYCIDEKNGRAFAEQICTEIGERDILYTLARELKTRVGIIPSYGIERIYEGMMRGENTR